MDSPRPRRCETCRHHRHGLTACTGSCLHPQLQPAAGYVRPLVRARELHCYLDWGRDFWEPHLFTPTGPDGHGGNGRMLLIDQSDPEPGRSFDSQWDSAPGRLFGTMFDAADVDWDDAADVEPVRQCPL